MFGKLYADDLQIYRNPNTFTVRLTDDDICEGSETSVLVQGGTFGMPCTLNIAGLSPIISNDSLFMVGLNLADGSYSITATVNGITSTNSATLTVQPAMSVTASITSGLDVPCADQDIILTAEITTSSLDINNSYTYLWVPDKHIQDNNPFQQNIALNNTELTTQAYQVFVYDGQCWASSNIIAFDRGPKSVDLGEDFTVCTSNDFDLRALITTSPLVVNGAFHYKLFENNVEVASGTTPDFNVTNPGTAGLYNYRVEVWSEHTSNSSEDCPVWDEIEVNIVNCCSCTSGISLNPSPHGADENPINNYSTESNLIDEAINNTSDFTVFLSTGDAQTVTITGLTLNYFCINGELWIRSIDLGNFNLKTLILQKCTLQLGPDALIKVRGRVKLILKGCVLKNCDGSTTMWDGVFADIEDQALTEPELEISMFQPATGNPIPTEIINAKNGVVARRESPFKIEDCIFDNNYKDIVIEKYNKNALSQSATIIRGCTFKKTAALLAPYDVVNKKFAAIELNDVEGRTIGDINSHNEISNSLYGIYSRNASFTLLNTEFRDLEEDVLVPNSGTGIYATSDFDFTDRKITLGNGNLNGRNTFLKSKNGLIGIGEINYNIQNNKFGNGTVNDRLLEYGVKIENSGGKEILIEDQNEFYDYKHGIDISSPSGKLYIHENTFYNAVFPANSRNFEGTAINVYGFYPIRLYNSEISLNTLGESGINNTAQPRIGIRLSLLDNIKLNQNNISFHIGTASDPYRGIWATDCNDLKLDLNSVINHNTFTANNVDLLTGIRFENSSNSCIENSILNNLGIGMRFEGTSIVQSLFKNTITEFDQGVFLFNNAFIGSTVGTEDPPGSGNGNVMGNIWNLCNGCTLTTKISGTILGLLTWYTDVPSGTKFPNNNVTGLNIIQLSTYTESSECLLSSFVNEDYGSAMSLLKRNQSFGSIVADSARYPEAYQEEFRYMTRETVFKILRSHPALIVKGDDSDTSFVSFYNGLLGSNMHKIDSLEKLILEGSYAAADTLLNYFATSNTVDYNYKKVYRVAIKVFLYGDTSITSSEKDELNEIAHQHPLLGGFGVYIARNLLDLEIYDENLSSERIMQPKVENKKREMTLYPNPANEYVILQLSDIANIDEIKIIDITGRVCINYYNTSLISTATLAPGIYLVNARSNGELFNISLIVNH